MKQKKRNLMELVFTRRKRTDESGESAASKAGNIIGKILKFFKSIPEKFMRLVNIVVDFAKREFNEIKSLNVRHTVIAIVVLLVIIALPILISSLSKNTKTVDIDADNHITTPEPTETQAISETQPVHVEYQDEGPVVYTIQARLMDLGYMDYDEPTEYYGPTTKSCYELFERQNGFEIDGVVEDEEYQLLMSNDAPKYMVSEGVEGDDVKSLQTRLYDLDYMKSVTGYFGSDTTEAVKLFQEKNNLTVDGKIGEQTRELLYSENAKANAISFGTKSDDVLKYQKRLKALGYLTTTPDGTFGQDTVSATKRFQEVNGLIADGWIGPETKNLLMSSDAEPNAVILGMSGNDVTRIQKRLVELKYMKNATGYFGSATEDAVKAFQKRNKLTQDGKVGPRTLEALNSRNAVKAASNSGGGSSSGGGSGSGSGSGSTNTSGVDRLISKAKSKLGCKYVLGAKGPDRFDCSGFVYWCLNQAGVRISYMTSYSWRTTTRFQRINSIDSVRRGDIIVYKMSASKGHVGIAISSNEMIDASSRNGKVVQRSFKTAYWRGVFYCAYRIF